MNSSVCMVTPYTLPMIDFIGGSTQDLVFNVYNEADKQPSDLSSCTAAITVINFANQTGEADISKPMTVEGKDLEIEGNVKNILHVQLAAEETIGLYGKFVYQISIQYPSGEMEQRQGLMYIMRNINQALAN